MYSTYVVTGTVYTVPVKSKLTPSLETRFLSWEIRQTETASCKRWGGELQLVNYCNTVLVSTNTACWTRAWEISKDWKCTVRKLQLYNLLFIRMWLDVAPCHLHCTSIDTTVCINEIIHVSTWNLLGIWAAVDILFSDWVTESRVQSTVLTCKLQTQGPKCEQCI